MKRFWRFFLLFFLLPVMTCRACEPRENDSIEVAIFFGDTNAPLSVNLTPPPLWQIGDERNFNVLAIQSGSISPCTGRIFLITDHAVFWYDISENPLISQEILDGLRKFDMETLPMLHQTFGTENNPGVDNDPRFHVLFTEKIGVNYNGYFSAEDSADPRVRPASNGMELLFLNTRLLQQGPDAVIDTLSHEFQHMIHFHYDRNEQSFINEGFSGLAEYLAIGKMNDIFIRNYLNDTGKSLIWWPDSGTNIPYYGASFLFSVYLYDRFGPDFIREVVSHTENGLNGIDRTLEKMNFPYSADDLFQQWTAALVSELSQMPISDWNYREYSFPQQGITRDIRTLFCGYSETFEAPQYSIRSFRGSCAGASRITVNGVAERPVTSLGIPDGNSAWWSGAVNHSMALLSHDFDLSDASGDIRFEYDVNFDIEDNYDYYYLLLKDSSGTVTRLEPSTVSTFNPAGLNLGSGTTGSSNGVIHESIDLNPWAGQKVRISFVYLTDTAMVSDGLLVNNIRIDAIGFSNDAENGDNGWLSEGFSRIGAALPQLFSLVVLHPAQYGTSRVELFTFTGGKLLTVDCPEGNCIFAVSPISRDIRSRASFTVTTVPLVIQ